MDFRGKWVCGREVYVMEYNPHGLVNSHEGLMATVGALWHSAFSTECFGYDAREVLLFELMYFCLDGLGSIVGRDIDSCLEKAGAFIAFVCHQMYRDSGFFLSGGYHRFMHMMPVHAFAAIFRKQRGMDVQNPLRIALKNEIRHHQQEAGQHDGVDMEFLQHSEYGIFVAKVPCQDGPCRNTECGGPLQHTCFRTVAYYECHVYPAFAVVAEITDYIFCVAAVAGCKNC